MRDFSSEILYRTARSGGKGGQNVNKVETMVEAWWQPAQTVFFTPEEQERIILKLQNRINKEGCLMVRSSETRSQLENKGLARQKMLELVNQAVLVPKARKATCPSRAVVERRLESKRRDSVKKQMRRKDW